jgi:hypothetical protein
MPDSTVANEPATVVKVKEMLHECLDSQGVPYYNPDNPTVLTDGSTVDDQFIDAIRRFQTDIPHRAWPVDGRIAIGGATYRELESQLQRQRQPTEMSEGENQNATPPKSFVYSLFMHLNSETVDDSLPIRFPWLSTVQLPYTTEEIEQQRQAETTDPLDGEKAYQLTDAVGPETGRNRPPNIVPDVQWVQRRLARHNCYYYDGEPDGIFNEGLEAAIREFQIQYVSYYQSHDADARIDPGHATEQSLRMTTWELNQARQRRDPNYHRRRFIECLQQINPDSGVAAVVTDINCRVSAGDILWTIGKGVIIEQEAEESDESEDIPLAPTLHWELFSKQPLIGLSVWNKIEDDNDDLTIDVVSLITQVEGEGQNGSISNGNANSQHPDGILSPQEIRDFYQTENSENWRHTQFRFCSEWGLNLDHAIEALGQIVSQGDPVWSTIGSKENWAPYQWWREAGTAVPESPLVWHYNPIAFMELYQAQFPRPAGQSNNLSQPAQGPTASNVHRVTDESSPEREEQMDYDGDTIP